MAWLYQPLLPAATDLLSTPSTDGFVKYYDGSQWLLKPFKIYDGSTWVTKPVKFWDGSQWVPTTSPP
jgi:hypothetical protein